MLWKLRYNPRKLTFIGGYLFLAQSPEELVQLVVIFIQEKLEQNCVVKRLDII